MENDFLPFYFSAERSCYNYINPGSDVILKITGGCRVDSWFYMYAVVNPSAKKFRVELRETKHSGESSAQLAYEVHLHEDYYSAIMTSPDTPPRKIKSHIPFGKQFYFRLECANKRFRFKIDEDDSVNYDIRTSDPITRSRYVAILGDIDIRSFHHYQAEGSPKDDEFLTIPQQVKVGDIFTFRGLIPKQEHDQDLRLAFNFVKMVSDQEENNYFHFNPRVSSDRVVRTSFIDDAWAAEETTENVGLQAETPYKLDVVVEEPHFRCFWNDGEFCTYTHKLPYGDITHVTILNHSENDTVFSTGLKSFVMNRINLRNPAESQYGKAISIKESGDGSVIYFPKVPVEMKMPRELEPGSCISVSGRFKDAKRFMFSIRGKGEDYVYKMKVDFPSRIIMHSIDDTNDSEKREIRSDFPLDGNEHQFDLQVLCGRKGELYISANDVLLDKCLPASGYESGTMIEIDGDVKIDAIAVLRTSEAYHKPTDIDGSKPSDVDGSKPTDVDGSKPADVDGSKPNGVERKPTDIEESKPTDEERVKLTGVQEPLVQEQLEPEI